MQRVSPSLPAVCISASRWRGGAVAARTPADGGASGGGCRRGAPRQDGTSGCNPVRMASRSQRMRPKLREGVRNPCMLFSSRNCQAICECGVTVDSRNRQFMRRLDILEQDICVHRLRACAPDGSICSAPAQTCGRKRGVHTVETRPLCLSDRRGRAQSSHNSPALQIP